VEETIQLISNGYAIVIAAVSAYVLLTAVINLVYFARVRRSPTIRGGALVSVLIPARNEEDSIEECLTGLFDQTYDNYEIVVFDDDSTDDTLEILRRLEKEHDKLRVVEGKEKPPEWKGKAFAVQKLAEAARGQYLYIVDADTQHDREAISWAVTQIEERELDVFSGLPRQITRSFAEKLLVPIIYLPTVFFPLPLFNARRLRRLGFGIGQFFMFRRDCFFEFGGMQPVKEEITEDLAMSLMLKRRGYRFEFIDTRGHVRCRMYGGFRDSIEGFTKNLYDLASVVPIFTAVATPIILFLFMIPTLLLIGTGIAAIVLPTCTVNWILLGAVVAFFLGWGAHLLYQRQSFWIIFLAPLFFGFLAVLIYYALDRYFKGKKPVWKSRKVDLSKT
jgi:chlorobactene glucosyltransferase